MRTRVVAVAALLAIVAGGAAVFGRSPTGAQEPALDPLLYSEIRTWCPPSVDDPGTGACDKATFSTLPDGAVRVELNVDAETHELDNRRCASGMTFPLGVGGIAFVLEGDIGSTVDIAALSPQNHVCELVVHRTF